MTIIHVKQNLMVSSELPSLDVSLDSERYRSRSAHDDYVDPRSTYSDFHDDGWLERDRTALERHKELVFFG